LNAEGKLDTAWMQDPRDLREQSHADQVTLLVGSGEYAGIG
jgi:hypothetical protein